MKPIAIFRHLACEGPGYFADYLSRYHLPYTLICIDQGDEVPLSIDDFSALVFMGGPMSVNDDLPWIGRELSLIQQAQQQSVPLLGHCLGGQLISKALGGTITPNAVKEIGWHPVQKTESAHTTPWTAKLPEEFLAFHWHGETFSIPEGATAILRSQFCDNQAFVIGNTLALQCHVEMTAEMVETWTHEHAAEITRPSDSIQSANNMLDNIDQKIKQLNGIADLIYQQWVAPLRK